MHGKAFFIDTTRCTACLGCQVACKEWNQLPATETLQWGSLQNPKDLSAHTWKLIRFSEGTAPDGRFRCFYFPDQCRHCLDPACAYVPDQPGAVVVDPETGAVIHTRMLSGYSFEDVRASCPFDIPRATWGDTIFGKCTMCLDRIHNGLLPACVAVCSTGAINFGGFDQMAALAQERLEIRKKRNPSARLSDLKEVRVFYLFDGDPGQYWQYAGKTVPGIDRQQALKHLVRFIGKRWIRV